MANQKLTIKEEKFAQAYVKTGNKSEAYRLSYSTKNQTKKSINENASRLSKRIKVLSRIEQLQAEISERNKITIDECVQRLTSMARFDLNDIYNEDGSLKKLSEIPEDSRMAIESLDTDEIKVDGKVVGYTRKLKISNRRANLIELMKHLGGYEKDNQQKVDKIPTREERDAFLNGLKEELKSFK